MTGRGAPAVAEERNSKSPGGERVGGGVGCGGVHMYRRGTMQARGVKDRQIHQAAY